MIPELRTERLRLRGFTTADRPAWAAMHADPKVMATLGAPLDRAAADALLDIVVARWDEHGYGWWCLDLDGECIGAAGVTTQPWTPPFRYQGDRVVDLGWRVAFPHWRRGYATEAAQAVLGYAFETYDWEEIVAFTSEGNVASRRVMEKLGMRHDPSASFDHPRLAPDHPLARHVLYRLARPDPGGRC